MTKLYRLLVLSTLALIGSCQSQSKGSIHLVPQQRYTMIEAGEPVFTAVATEGGLYTHVKSMEEWGKLYFYGNSGGGLSGVSFRTSIYLGGFNFEGETAVARIHRQGLRDFERATAEHITHQYTPAFKNRLGLTRVEGRILYLKGFKCARIDEYQDYLAGISFATSYIDCPVFINGEPRIFGASYRISMVAEKYHQTYGEKAKTFDELMAYHDRLIAPIYDSIEFFQTVTQELPEQGDKYPKNDGQRNQINITSEHSTYECVVNCGNDGTGERTEPRAANERESNE